MRKVNIITSFLFRLKSCWMQYFWRRLHSWFVLAYRLFVLFQMLLLALTLYFTFAFRLRILTRRSFFQTYINFSKIAIILDPVFLPGNLLPGLISPWLVFSSIFFSSSICSLLMVLEALSSGPLLSPALFSFDSISSDKNTISLFIYCFFFLIQAEYFHREGHRRLHNCFQRLHQICWFS